MALSLYDLTVPNYLQVLRGVDNVLQKGAVYAAEQGQDPDAFTSLRLHEDMLPFNFQVISVWHHSLGAIRGIKAGLFEPPPKLSQLNFEDLRNLVREAIEELSAQSRDEIDGLIDEPMVFKMGQTELPFSTPNFVQSFSQPNFYFHAATIYAMLRMQGVPLGKMDYLGTLRTG